MDSKKRISYLQDKISLKDFGIRFWEVLDELPDEKLTFDFLFSKSSEELKPFFQICSIVYQSTFNLPKKENFNLTRILHNFSYKVAVSKHLSDADKIEITKYSEGKVSSLNAKDIQYSYLMSETFQNLLRSASLPDESFDQFLRSKWIIFTRNENLTSQQYIRLLNYILYDFKTRVNGTMLQDIRLYKPEEIKLELTHDWLFLKTCFDLEEPGNAKILKSFLKGIDIETFKALETSWPGSLKDLIEACAFNGPDK